MEFIREGRAFNPGAVLFRGGRDEEIPGLGGTEDDQHDPAAEFIGERRLAAAVFAQAFIDLGVRMPGTRGKPGAGKDPETIRARATAKLFLLDPEWKQMREHWLGLLGLTDGEFQALLSKREHQGQANRVLAILRPAIGGLMEGAGETAAEHAFTDLKTARKQFAADALAALEVMNGQDDAAELEPA